MTLDLFSLFYFQKEERTGMGGIISDWKPLISPMSFVNSPKNFALNPKDLINLGQKNISRFFVSIQKMHVFGFFFILLDDF